MTAAPISKTPYNLHAPEHGTGRARGTPNSSRRLVAVDVVRGLAIAGVVVFHLVWDLEFTGFVSGIAQNPVWLVFGHVLAGSFMVLVGVSLHLAHQSGIRRRPFVRRLAVLLMSALAITVVTLTVFPGAFIYFGILHAIAAATLIGVVFLRAPAKTSILAGIVMVSLPYLLQSATFDTRWLAWIGFSANAPPSNDYVPIFPWVGLTLIGIAAARWALSNGMCRRLRTYPPKGPVAIVLTWLGRNSLPIYLLHQPVLLAIIVPLSGVQWA